jgi:hypothetical protein
MENLVMLKLDFGLRNAFGEEIIVLTQAQYDTLNNNIGTEIYIGEWEGKHSEVSGTIEKEDFKVIECSQEFKIEFLKLFKNGFGLPIFNAFEESIK